MPDEASLKQALSTQLYDDYITCRGMYLHEPIERALMERRFEDADKLILKKARLGYDTTEALSDEVKPRLEVLQTLLTTRYAELATAEDIDNCKLCNQHMNMIEKILNGPKL